MLLHTLSSQNSMSMLASQKLIFFETAVVRFSLKIQLSTLLFTRDNREANLVATIKFGYVRQIIFRVL